MNAPITAINLSEAPDAVRKEIEALTEKEGGVSFGDFNKLSESTKRYLHGKAMEDTGQLTRALTRRYQEATELVDIAPDGLLAMSKVTGDELADKLNRDLYNACAKFCRAYNIQEMDS